MFLTPLATTEKYLVPSTIPSNGSFWSRRFQGIDPSELIIVRLIHKVTDSLTHSIVTNQSFKMKNKLTV